MLHITQMIAIFRFVACEIQKVFLEKNNDVIFKLEYNSTWKMIQNPLPRIVKFL